MMKRIKKWLSNQILRFLLVGACSTGIDFIIYMLLSFKLDITVSKGISMIASSLFSYFVNKNYTFVNEEKTDLKLLIRFYLVFATNLIVNLSINDLVFCCTGSKIIAFICATLCGMTVNYVGQRCIVFKQDVD